MTNIEDKYFDWLYGIVCSDGYFKKLSFRKLFATLHVTDFEYTIPMDSNRFEDGIDLRYRFGMENGYSQSEIASFLDTRPCSVLEMMIALSLRCEERIMSDPDLGNRTGLWFWTMIDNLGIGRENDSVYDEMYVRKCLSRFLYRAYAPNGKGGLFALPNFNGDLTTVEIWNQAMWYLNYILEN